MAAADQHQITNGCNDAGRLQCFKAGGRESPDESRIQFVILEAVAIGLEIVQVAAKPALLDARFDRAAYLDGPGCTFTWVQRHVLIFSVTVALKIIETLFG